MVVVVVVVVFGGGVGPLIRVTTILLSSPASKHPIPRQSVSVLQKKFSVMDRALVLSVTIEAESWK